MPNFHPKNARLINLPKSDTNAEITNVILNVAKVINVLGIGEFANPMKAHNGYQSDERVIGLITKGLGQGEDDPVKRKQCTWLEMVDE